MQVMSLEILFKTTKVSMPRLNQKWTIAANTSFHRMTHLFLICLQRHLKLVIALAKYNTVKWCCGWAFCFNM